MRFRPFYFPFLVISAVVVTAGAFLSTPVSAETLVIRGQTYEDVRIGPISPSTVTLFHRGGITQLQLRDLPPELQKRFHYDPYEERKFNERKAAETDARVAAEEAAQKERDARAAREQAQAAARSPTEIAIRAKVDLRSAYGAYELRPKNQGRRPSCAVFAIVSALEYEVAKRGESISLSDDFLIWATRKMYPDIPLDDGYHFEEIMTALQTYGVPRFDLMPDTVSGSLTSRTPDTATLTDASTRRDVVPIWYLRGRKETMVAILRALNDGSPVVVGVNWPNTRSLEHNYLLDDQKPVAGSGHAVTLVGYQAANGNSESITFIFRNSYGPDWGNDGYGLMTFSYLRNNLLGALRLKILDGVSTLAARP